MYVFGYSGRSIRQTLDPRIHEGTRKLVISVPSRVNKMLSRRELLKHLSAAGAGACLRAEVATVRKGGGSSEHADALTVAGWPVEMSLTVVSPRTLRISLLAIRDGGQTLAIGDNLALVRENWPAPVARIRSISEPRIIPCGSLRVKVSAQPLLVNVERNDGKPIQQLQINADNGSVGFSLGHGPIFGLGEGGPQFDRRGTVYLMRSGSGVPDLRTNGARVPIPWLIGTGGWAMFVHQPIGSFDLTGKDARFEPWTSEPAIPLDLFIVAADQPTKILEEYARLTGFPHMPPIWALGYQQSHRTLVSREEVLSEAKTFREKKLLCDIFIYLGTGFCPSGWNAGHGSFTFNPRVFPDPEKMIRELHEENFRVVLHVVNPPRTCTAVPATQALLLRTKVTRDDTGQSTWTYSVSASMAGSPTKAIGSSSLLV